MIELAGSMRSLHIDKSKNIILVPYKLSEAGFRAATEPIIQADSKEWDDISRYILNLLEKKKKKPLAGENRSGALDKILLFIIFSDYQMEHMEWKKIQ